MSPREAVRHRRAAEGEGGVRASQRVGKEVGRQHEGKARPPERSATAAEDVRRDEVIRVVRTD